MFPAIFQALEQAGELGQFRGFMICLFTVLLTLNLLAVLFHTILDLVDKKYRLLQEHLALCQTFFNEVWQCAGRFYDLLGKGSESPRL